MISLLRAITLAAVLTVFFVGRTSAQEAPSAQISWRLLDYLAVDYSGAVAKGQVINASEYAEMREFSRSVRERLSTLPATPAQPELLRRASGLVAAINAQEPAEIVAKQARALADELLLAYPTPLAPSAPPDLVRGERLYVENCADCHGTNGDGRGPGANGLDPPPVAFRGLERARQRSLFAFYQVISQGLEGTAMKSFAHLSPEDRWSLALYAGGFAFGGDAIPQGELLWRNSPALRARLSGLSSLMQTTPAALASEIGEPNATIITAYLRHNPSAVLRSSGASLNVSRTKLAESLAASQAGDSKRAEQLALAAYLDGFEPVEPMLASRNAPLLAKIETAMGAFRASLAAPASSRDVTSRKVELDGLLTLAEEELSADQASPASTFLGAFTILLREGLEALLIVVAMLAFLRKADRKDAISYVHAGWIAALAAGAMTWVAGTLLISISGASRELTEGFGSLLSAIVLISVGIWMHGKSQADAWQAYIKEKMSAALSKGSRWFLFGLAFVVVYREVFETILFYAALWSQGAQLALISGAGLAATSLAFIAWALLAYSRRLPISRFFAYSALLIAGLAVVLAGKGVAALQEAGLIGVRSISELPRIEVLGLFPTLEGALVQLFVLGVVVLGFWITSRGKPSATN